MAYLNQQLVQAADRNRELLGVLAQTEYAEPSLKQNISYISDLQSQIAETDKDLKKLHNVTEDEHKDHIKYSDSVVRRYAYRLGGHKGQEKFASKQAKEEREFLEAWQREREAQERRAELQRALDMAQSDSHTLENDKMRHAQAQNDLDQMYQFIFSGPTPEVQGEDQMEQAVAQARDWYQQCENQSAIEKRASEALERANKYLKAGLKDMDDAHQRSEIDLWGGGTFTDMMERDALSKAQVNFVQCLRAMDDARRSQPGIQELTEVNIDQGHIVSDVLFDNIFTDLAQHERIEKSREQMAQAMGQLQVLIGHQRQRSVDAQSVLKQASNQLEDARKELQRIRSEAFQNVCGGGEAPPPY